VGEEEEGKRSGAEELLYSKGTGVGLEGAQPAGADGAAAMLQQRQHDLNAMRGREIEELTGGPQRGGVRLTIGPGWILYSI
jgi:hypothetical protein